jgi:hypothetical protein
VQTKQSRPQQGGKPGGNRPQQRKPNDPKGSGARPETPKPQRQGENEVPKSE